MFYIFLPPLRQDSRPFIQQRVASPQIYGFTDLYIRTTPLPNKYPSQHERPQLPVAVSAYLYLCVVCNVECGMKGAGEMACVRAENNTR